MINIKVKLKIFLILFVTFFSIYTIYLYNSNLYEGLQNNINKQIKDCSDCSIKPSSGDCLPLYEFSMNLPTSITNTNDFLEIDVIDTSYIFCPSKPKCNDDICKNTGTYFEYTCCNDSPWYNNNIITYKDISFVQQNQNTCKTIDASMSDYTDKYNNNPDFTDWKTWLDFFTNIPNYGSIKKICNNNRDTKIANTKGMIFKKELVETKNILDNPNLTVQEIIDYQNILEMSLNRISNENGYIETKRLQGIEIKTINSRLKELNPLSITYKTDKQNLVNQLKKYFNTEISYNILNYQLKKDNNSMFQDVIPGSEQSFSSYLLKENEFLNCFGNKLSITNPTFTQENENDFSNNNYFGISHENILTYGESVANEYGPKIDELSQLKSLENIPENSQVSSNIVGQYLGFINSFYDKQMNKIYENRYNHNEQILQMDRNNLDLKEKTFFVYENEPTNNYQCQESITGDNTFKYCGPAPNYQIPDTF
tara:strand:+ start:78 stop:1523 length:1446 start_codon:yes stop_codon:yes gene_type:complete